jgi:ADP-ribose pyrophosphatase YjhB (NUDIX family)
VSEPTRSGVQRFARYRPTSRTIRGRRFWSLPEGGVCLSAFLVIRPKGTPSRVLLGRPNPVATWEHMATLEAEHLTTIGDRWILPASHLLEFESPADSARRILRQQLEVADLFLRGPEVFSESYPSALDPESGLHWDLHFVFRGDWPSREPPRPSAWRELAFLDTRTLTQADMARGHADILALAGVPVGVQGPR